MDDTGSDDLVRRTARCGKGMERFLPQSVTSTWCARRAAERHAIILVELALIQPFDLRVADVVAAIARESTLV